MPRFTIIYDTYCGWCYGAAPILEALAAQQPVTLLHRYLFCGPNAYRMGDGFGSQAAVIDARIHALTGQEFSATYKRNILQNPDEVLDSGLAAQAAILARDLGPAAELSLTARLQHGYYVEGHSTRDQNFVAGIVSEIGLDASRLGSDLLLQAAIERSHEAESLMSRAGLQGVPAVLRHGETTEIVNLSAFYKTPTDILHLAS